MPKKKNLPAATCGTLRLSLVNRIASLLLRILTRCQLIEVRPEERKLRLAGRLSALWRLAKHHNAQALSIIRGPRAQAFSVRVAVPGKVHPIGRHFVRHLPVTVRPRPAAIQMAERIEDLRHVRG